MAGKRSIFEEVSTTEKVAAAQPGLIDRGSRGVLGVETAVRAVVEDY